MYRRGLRSGLGVLHNPLGQANHGEGVSNAPGCLTKVAEMEREFIVTSMQSDSWMPPKNKFHSYKTMSELIRSSRAAAECGPALTGPNVVRWRRLAAAGHRSAHRLDPAAGCPLHRSPRQQPLRASDPAPFRARARLGDPQSSRPSARVRPGPAAGRLYHPQASPQEAFQARHGRRRAFRRDASAATPAPEHMAGQIRATASDEERGEPHHPSLAGPAVLG